MMDKLVKIDPNAPGLLSVERARVWLAEAVAVDEVKALRDKAEAIASYQRKQRAGKEAAVDADLVVVFAERRLGELSRELETDPGGRPSEKTLAILASVSGKGKALEKHGIKHRSASRYEAAARRAVLKLRRVYQCPRRKKGFTFPGMPFLLENVQPFLTIDQTASLLQVSRRTITRWIGSGQLPRLKPIKGAKAGRVLVARSEIERFLTEAAQ